MKARRPVVDRHIGSDRGAIAQGGVELAHRERFPGSEGYGKGDGRRRRDQRGLRPDRARRTALTSVEKAVIRPRATIVLYRLIRRVERVVIVPLLFAKVSSVPGLAVFEGRDPGIERTRCGPTSRSR